MFVLDTSSSNQTQPCNDPLCFLSFPGWLCDDDGWGGGNNINNDDGGNEAPPAPEMEVFRETFTLDYDVVNYVELDASAIDALQDAVLGAAASSNTPDFVDVTVTRVAIDATEPPQQQEVEDPPAYSIPAKCYRKNGNLRKNRKCQAAAEAAEAAAAIAAAEAAMQENSAEHAYDAHHTISLKVSILAESPEAVFDFANNKVLRSEMADEICFALSGEAPFKKNGIANCELRLARKSGGAIGRNRNRSSP